VCCQLHFQSIFFQRIQFIIPHLWMNNRIIPFNSKARNSHWNSVKHFFFLFYSLFVITLITSSAGCESFEMYMEIFPSTSSFAFSFWPSRQTDCRTFYFLCDLVNRQNATNVTWHIHRNEPIKLFEHFVHAFLLMD
jgi:hypothetical protein